MVILRRARERFASVNLNEHSLYDSSSDDIDYETDETARSSSPAPQIPKFSTPLSELLGYDARKADHRNDPGAEGAEKARASSMATPSRRPKSNVIVFDSESDNQEYVGAKKAGEVEESEEEQELSFMPFRMFASQGFTIVDLDSGSESDLKFTNEPQHVGISSTPVESPARIFINLDELDD